MSDWQIMAQEVDLPIAPGDPIDITAGWEPIGTLARQGNTAVVFCRRPAPGSPPPGGDPPVITSLDPNSLASGSPPLTVEILGSGFDTSCQVYANGDPRVTFYVSDTQLQYTARPDLMPPGPVQITVEGDNGTSNPVTFTYT